VIVAVVAVRVVQMTVDEVIDVITVRDGWMPAIRAVRVVRCMPVARMTGRASIRVGPTDGDRALVDVVAVHLVKMTVVEIVDVPVVLYR